MRRSTLELCAWALAGAVGLALLVWAFPRAFPLFPRPWSVSRQTAELLALERLRDLGEPVEGALVVVHVRSDPTLERRLQLALAEGREVNVLGSGLGERILYWEVLVYAPGAAPGAWTYRAAMALGGDVLALEHQPDENVAGAALGEEEARTVADRFLAEQGFDLARFGESSARIRQLDERTDLTLRYPDRTPPLGERFPSGLEVLFSGERLSGYRPWLEDPEKKLLEAALEPALFLDVGRNVMALLLLPLVAVPFLRRYHAGVVGVRRGVQILVVVLALAALLMLLSATPSSEGTRAGILTRQQMAWLYPIWLLAFFFLPISFVSFLSWSVGESLCRERWGHKLAAFDALFQGKWGNATVARSALCGTAAGLVLAGGMLGSGVLLVRWGMPPLASLFLGPWWHETTWSGPALVCFVAVLTLHAVLFGVLLLVTALRVPLGRAGAGIVATLIGGFIFYNPALVVPSNLWILFLGAAAFGALVVLFLRYDLLAALLAGVVGGVALMGVPLLTASDGWLQLQGSLALLVAGLPFLVTLRYVASGREFAYRYEDVPLHVRRIAERERQRVELETARRIQSSILPELPPRLAGVEIAHTYLPATEVGGDFYDVLALEDGRLALAVGDVAGHGVSSGLVMSMAKSALAVQVTFDPDVAAVFTTLNRMVFQSARKRLLATLCYALLDPRTRRLDYASAGHLFPYRVSERQAVALESIAYPLGVREGLEVRVRQTTLVPGDYLFLFSDGVVEAHPEGSDELFGFARLEESLRRHAGSGVRALRDGVLDDLAAFAGDAPREDDLTVLVLQVP